MLLTLLTGNPVWDGIGSVAIGLPADRYYVMTRENLLNGGRTYVDQFTQVLTAEIAAAAAERHFAVANAGAVSWATSENPEQAIIEVTLENATPYYQAYGSASSAAVYEAIGQLLLRVVNQKGSPEDFIGYLAGQFLDRTPDRRRAVSELFPAACLLIEALERFSHHDGERLPVVSHDRELIGSIAKTDVILALAGSTVRSATTTGVPAARSTG